MQTLIRTGSITPRPRAAAAAWRAGSMHSKSPLRFGRTCHLVDIENLVGQPESGPRYTPAVFSRRAHEVSGSYRLKWVHPGDLVYVGCDASLLLETLMDWEQYSVRIGKGADGADRALMAVFDIDAVARSCDVLQIASGDHAFAEVASQARERGLYVRVVSRSDALSHDLRRNSDGVYTFA